MNTVNTPHRAISLAVLGMLAVGATVISESANATILNAPTSGVFTMNLDKDALTPYSGYFLSAFWDAAASDYSNPLNTGDYLNSRNSKNEIPAINQMFDLTPIGNDPTGQAAQRFLKATSANFFIDSDTLVGVDSVDGAFDNRVAGAQIGMAGVQGFYAPDWLTACCGLGGGLVNGDFSLTYDSTRQTDGRSGWYLANNIHFTMAVYDFSDLSVVFTDANNWQLSGDLLMSPENGGMLKGASLNDVGDFCLGVGSYAGCGQIATVPLPGTVWFFAAGLLGIGARLRCKQFH